MRLIHFFKNEQEARSFAAYLNKQQIENELESHVVNDWGSSDYGTTICKLWIIDEDKVEAAKSQLEVFLQQPNDKRYQPEKPTPNIDPKPFHLKEYPETDNAAGKLARSYSQTQKHSGVITFYVLLICVLLFLLIQFTSKELTQYPSALAAIPVLAPPIEKELLYDYPAAYQILDKVIKDYGVEDLLHPDKLPPKGQALIDQFHHTPFWKGLYPKIIDSFTSLHPPISFDKPMFEKISQGEVWRLFTPALLHSDIFHILFNMLWLIALGKQIEQRLGGIRYLAFIMITAAFSNTAQYLMTGPDFIGFSGVLCAMITFVWFRQKRAPWEGYHLLPSTMGFITVFIIAMVGIESISFLFEIYGKKHLFNTNIANTAHLSGALSGAILARFNLKGHRL